MAKMDATANDVPPQFQVQGFPTIYYAPKGKKSSPRKYDVMLRPYYHIVSNVETLLSYYCIYVLREMAAIHSTDLCYDISLC